MKYVAQSGSSTQKDWQMPPTKAQQLLTRATVVLSLALVAGLYACFWVFQSQLALAQAADSFLDVFTASVLAYTMAISALPSDENHPFGHARAQPIGALVAAVTSYAFDGRAKGVIDASGNVRPSSFKADSSSPRAKRRTVIEWDGATPVRVSVEPPRKHAPDPARVVGALDPVSAGFALLRDNAPENICAVSVDVFDGSRRSRLTVGEPVAEDGGFVCRGIYARLEGEAHSLSSQAEYPFTLHFAPAGDGLVRIERIETETRFGPAVVSRRG